MSVRINAMVLGDSGAGKTSLIRRLTETPATEDGAKNQNSDDGLLTTMGPEFSSRRYSAAEVGADTNVVVWDTAGQERFNSLAILKGLARSCFGIVLVFDLTRRETFENICDRWLALARDSGVPSGCQFVLVGNKADLCEDHRPMFRSRCQSKNAAAAAATPKDNLGSRQQHHQHRLPPRVAIPSGNRRAVTTSEADAFARREGIAYFETSAAPATVWQVETVFLGLIRGVLGFAGNRVIVDLKQPQGSASAVGCYQDQTNHDGGGAAIAVVSPRLVVTSGRMMSAAASTSNRFMAKGGPSSSSDDDDQTKNSIGKKGGSKSTSFFVTTRNSFGDCVRRLKAACDSA